MITYWFWKMFGKELCTPASLHSSLDDGQLRQHFPQSIVAALHILSHLTEDEALL